jgi:hypothetical protein
VRGAGAGEVRSPATTAAAATTAIQRTANVQRRLTTELPSGSVGAAAQKRKQKIGFDFPWRQEPEHFLVINFVVLLLSNRIEHRGKDKRQIDG